jgi:hypothetical protein
VFVSLQKPHLLFDSCDGGFACGSGRMTRPARVKHDADSVHVASYQTQQATYETHQEHWPLVVNVVNGLARLGLLVWL